MGRMAELYTDIEETITFAESCDVRTSNYAINRAFMRLVKAEVLSNLLSTKQRHRIALAKLAVKKVLEEKEGEIFSP